MKVKELKEIIKDMPDDDILFIALFDKDEADEHAMSNLNDEKDFKFSEYDWSDIVDKMNSDEGVWQEIMGSFRYCVEVAFNKTKKGDNDNSK
jgi:hypothetical protein